MTRPEGAPFRFAGEGFVARPSGALWWGVRRMLIAADLHLGRSERYARRGGALLPPWEVTDTLDRLTAEVAALNPASVVLLGDSFDDDMAATAIPARARAQLRALAEGRDWLWIAGNHDRAAPGPEFPGRSLDELPGPITLRHEAGEGPDISGHLHPIVRLAGRRWRCFAIGERHLILPAFGTYTGGLEIDAPAFAPLAGGGIAITCTARGFTVPIHPAGTAAGIARLRRNRQGGSHGTAEHGGRGEAQGEDPQG